MIGWAIQHIPTGGFLPVPYGRGGRGGTHVEPTQIEFPRIFVSKAAAQCALTIWLAGKITVTYDADYEGVVGEDWHTERVDSRRAEDMRVVALKVEIVE